MADFSLYKLVPKATDELFSNLPQRNWRPCHWDLYQEILTGCTRVSHNSSLWKKCFLISSIHLKGGGGGLIQFAQAIPEISFQTCGEKFPDPSRLCASLVVNHSRPVTALTYVQLLQICIYVEHGTWILGFFPLSVARYHLQEHLFKNKILGLQIQKFHGFFLREKRVCLCWTEIMVTLLREGDANRTQA